jgi:CHRD domain
MKQTIGVALLAAAILMSGRPLSAQNGKTFKARLSTVPIDVAMQATVSGSGALSAVLTGTTLSITGTFDGLRSPATIAQVHRGPKGIRGPVAFDLTVSKATSGSVSGRIELTPPQVADLENGRLYVQLHSEMAPDGNLWGWLLQETRP